MLDTDTDTQNGVLVSEITENGAFARDGRVKPGDILLSINYESVRRISQAQARAILRRVQLVTTDLK